mmetsp:Transcript_24252/g.68782  ORF Transcript_24252/g.68782 Transcript_24252/m.68782 type:complete len:279 (-) Transcript_24252:35-871(-)
MAEGEGEEDKAPGEVEEPTAAASLEETAAAIAAEAVGESANLEDAEGSKQKELDKGKDAYNRGDFKEAIKAWQCSFKSVNYILEKGLYKDKPKELQEVFDMEHKVAINIAQAYLKTGEYNKAIESADKALNRHPDSAKALYRKASAHMQLLNFSEAEEVLEKLLEVEPENAAAKQMLATAGRNNLVSDRKAKKMSQKIFSGLSSDPRVPVPVREPTMLEWLQGLPAEFWRSLEDLLTEVRQLLAEARQGCWELARSMFQKVQALGLFRSAAVAESKTK